MDDGADDTAAFAAAENRRDGEGGVGVCVDGEGFAGTRDDVDAAAVGVGEGVARTWLAVERPESVRFCACRRVLITSHGVDIAAAVEPLRIPARKTRDIGSLPSSVTRFALSWVFMEKKTIENGMSLSNVA